MEEVVWKMFPECRKFVNHWFRQRTFGCIRYMFFIWGSLVLGPLPITLSINHCVTVYFNISGCSEPLGMKSGLISDQQISASSVYKTWGINAFSWHPHYARLDKIGKSNAWAALHNKPDEWLQVSIAVTVWTTWWCESKTCEHVAPLLAFESVR